MNKTNKRIHGWSVVIGRFMAKTTLKKVLLFFAVVLVVFCVGAFFKGTGIGMFIADMVYDGSFKDYLYAKDSGHNGFWSIVATVLGELLLSGLILATIIGFFRSMGERYENGNLRKYRWKNHILFLGYDAKIAGTLKACKDTIVIVAVPNNVKEIRNVVRRNLSGIDMKYMEFVQCRRSDADDLRDKACILTASKIYIIGQPDEYNHDALNFKSLAVISNECKKAKKNPHIITYLKNQSSVSMLKKNDIKCENLKNLLPEKDVCLDQVFLDQNCEFFNFYSDTAFRLLTNDMKLDWLSESKNLAKCKDRQVHLVVMGMTGMGVAIVREALKLAHPSGDGTRFKVTMVDENAYKEMHYFIGCTKELFELCNYKYYDYDNPDRDFSYVPANDFLDVEFEFVQCDAAHPKLMKNLSEWAADSKQLVTLVVCMKRSSQNMAVALYLPTKLRVGEDAIPVWVYQEGDDSLKHLLDDNIHTNIHPFSVDDNAVFTVLRQETTNEKYRRTQEMALAFEEAYWGKKPDWGNMTALNRWSSIYNGFSMDIKLRAVADDIFSTDAEKVEKAKLFIDKTEHDRWNVEKLSEGFIPTTQEQHDEVMRELEEQLKKNPNWRDDNDQSNNLEGGRIKFTRLKKADDVKGIKIHDNIRSFEDLDDYSKYKDRFLLDNYLRQLRDNK